MIKLDIDDVAFKSVMAQLSVLTEDPARDSLRKSLNDTARELQAHMRRKIDFWIDRPKDITKNSLYSQFATNTKLESKIFFKNFAGKKTYKNHWLSSLIKGGSRSDKALESALKTFGILPRGYNAIPVEDVRTDGFGNIGRGISQDIISWLRIDYSGTQNVPVNFSNDRQRQRYNKRKNRYFVVSVGSRNNLSPGIYQYRSMFGSRGVRMIFMFVPSVSYGVMFPFENIAREFSLKILPERLRTRIAEAFKR